MSDHTYVVELAAASADAAGTLSVPPLSADVPKVLYTAGQSLAQAVYLSGLFLPPVLCSGLARCGRCRMRILTVPPAPIEAEKRYFSPEDLAMGWRLACRHFPCPGMRVELPAGTMPFTKGYGDARGKLSAPPKAAPASSGQTREKTPAVPADARHVLAIDLGTTSLQWRHTAIWGEGSTHPGHAVIWEGSTVNPQMGAGSDVVSRLAVAMDSAGMDRLRRLSRESLRVLAEGALKYARAAGAESISALCLAANPAMTCISLGKDIRGLAAAPYSLPFSGGDWEQLAGLPPVWIPPQLSPFVGGDISAGYAALALDPQSPSPSYPFLLADLGTNGEFLLALGPDEAWSASVALGPALEGTGLSHGTEARPGAITSFVLTPRGLEAHVLPGHEQSTVPHGITGTGYISLLSILLKSGVLERDGRFCHDMGGPLRRSFRIATDEAGLEKYLELPMGLRLTATDVEELLKVKAAFSLGLRRLLDKVELPSSRLARVYVAGALGLHVDKQGLEELGFFPPGMGARMEAVGNSSLEGASVLLENPSAREALVAWASKVRNLELASDALFLQDFPAHMHFSWRDAK